MSKTSLLPPFTAVRLVWARTGAFSEKAKHSQLAATLAEDAQKNIKVTAEKEKANNPEEYEYVNSATATMDAGLRNLDIVYKGRELNFEENEKLRSTYLNAVKETLEFGNSFKDFLKSLPTMTIGSVTGIAFAQSILKISDERLWGIGLGLAAVSYLVNLLIVKLMRKRKQQLYIIQDYERTLYYEQYVNRTEAVLTSLYNDIDRIHKNVFGAPYPAEKSTMEIIGDILEGVKPTFCKYTHKHLREKRITPELWSLCETGNEDETKDCPEWKKEG